MTREIRYNVAGDPHGDTPVLQPDNPAGAWPIDGVFETPGRLLTVIPGDNTGAATLKYQHGQKSFRIILPPLNVQGQWEASDPQVLPPEYHGDADKVALHYGAAVSEEVQIVGDHFELHGKRWLIRGVDGFCDLAILLDHGHDILVQQLRQSQELGVRLRRVFGCIKNIRQFNPFTYGEAYFQAIPELFSLYAEHGMYGEFDALPDSGYWGFSLGQCQELWRRDVETLTPIPNRLLSLTNEFDHGGNLVGSPNDYARPPFALCSQGSAVSDAPPPRPGWGFREFHCLKDWPKIFLCEDMLFNREGVDADGHRWGDAKPTYLSECARFEEGKPDTDERLARTLALETAGIGEGFVVHNEFGKDGRLMGPRVASCVKTAMDLLIRIEG